MAQNEKRLSVGLVFDDTLDSSDGVSQQVKRLGEYLTLHGHKVVYLCGETKLSDYAGGKVYSLSKNIKVRFNGNRLSMPIYSNRKHIKRVITDEKLDVLHVMAPYSPLLAQRIVAIGYRRGLAVVGSFHILPSGWLSSMGARILGLVQLFSLKKFQTFTATSKSASEFAAKTMRIKSVVVPNMVDLSKLEPGRRAGNTPGRIVFLGRLVERKGLSKLIQALPFVLKSHPDVELVVAGDGPDRSKMENLAAELGLKDKIKFLGYVEESDKANVLGSAEIACFPALYGESFGVVLIEAMAAGAGVVLAGDNPGYRCVMEQRPRLLVDPTNTKEFADRLHLLITDKKLADDLHVWQNEHVKQYDINVVGAQILDIYGQAIAKKTKSSDN